MTQFSKHQKGQFRAHKKTSRRINVKNAVRNTKISCCSAFLRDCVSGEISADTLKNEMKHFSGGQLKKFYHKWSTLANEKVILDIISKGLKLDFNPNLKGRSIPYK